MTQDRIRHMSVHHITEKFMSEEMKEVRRNKTERYFHGECGSGIGTFSANGECVRRAFSPLVCGLLTCFHNVVVAQNGRIARLGCSAPSIIKCYSHWEEEGTNSMVFITELIQGTKGVGTGESIPVPSG